VTRAGAAVDVHVLSAREELLALLRTAMAICIGVWMYVAVTVGPDDATSKDLLPFQKLIAERDPAEQRMFRELQEGLIEAERARDERGQWPTPQLLAEEGIPPFADDPTRRTRYEWRLEQSGPAASYVGVPADGGSPAWMLLLQDPTPGVPPDQNFEDEEHHRLANGVMLHVSTWVHPPGSAVSPRLTLMPQAEGWIQLYAVGPGRGSPPPIVN
jgi:hypothetical protein